MADQADASGCAEPGLTFLVASVGGLVIGLLLDSAWNECKIAIPGFNLLTAAIEGLVAAIVIGVVYGLSVTRIRLGSQSRRRGIALALALVASYALLYAFLPLHDSGALFDSNGLCSGHVPDDWRQAFPLPLP